MEASTSPGPCTLLEVVVIYTMHKSKISGARAQSLTLPPAVRLPPSSFSLTPFTLLSYFPARFFLCTLINENLFLPFSSCPLARRSCTNLAPSFSNTSRLFTDNFYYMILLLSVIVFNILISLLIKQN